MSDDPNEIADWLRRLKWSLARVPSPEREEIVEETRAHLREAVAGGKTPAQALDGFGAPEEYARRFVDEMDVAGALGSQAPGQMLAAVGRRVHRSLVAALAGAVVLVLAGAVFLALTMVVYKLGDPVHAGVWRGAHQFFIGVIDDPSQAQELLGNWLYPAALLTIVLGWLIARVVLVWALKSMARPR